MKGWSLAEAIQRCGVGDLRPALGQGQLVGYARPVNRTNELTAIPQSIWSRAETFEDSGGVWLHHPICAELFDVRILPTLHAPDAPELLHGKSLSEVFHSLVFNDPEVVALRFRAVSDHTYPQIVYRQYAPRLPLNPNWDADRALRPLLDNFHYFPVLFPGKSGEKPTEVHVSACTAVALRIAAFRELMSSGSVAATGTYRTTGEGKPIHPAQWERADQMVDVRNGDICEHNGGDWTPTWTGVQLEHPPPFPASSISRRFQVAINGASKSPRSTIAAEKQCESWLKELVRYHPHRRPWSKKELFQEALKWWGGLSGESFERAWSSATANEAGKNWRKAGALPKGPRPPIPSPVI